VKKISFIEPYIPKVNEESLVKLSEVMKWNKSVESLTVYFWGNPQRERLFATMANVDVSCSFTGRRLSVLFH
jgi:hypothetical protein